MRVDTPPVIDGQLDDEAWRTATVLTQFVQQSPLDGAPATEPTEVYIADDSDHLYFGFAVHSSDPSIMRTSWGPEFGYGRLFDFDGVLQGDQLFFGVDNPFLGRGIGGNINVTLRPVSRFQARLSFDLSRLTDPRNGDVEVFNVKIVRAQSTYQFTDRLLLRNITEFNTFDDTLDLNLLFTYRVNAGTVFYGGYDDHYQQADRLGNDLDGDGRDDPFLLTQDYRRTNRAVFMKVQYVFRY